LAGQDFQPALLRHPVFGIPTAGRAKMG